MLFKSAGFRVQGSGFRVQGSGFRHEQGRQRVRFQSDIRCNGSTDRSHFCQQCQGCVEVPWLRSGARGAGPCAPVAPYAISVPDTALLSRSTIHSLSTGHRIAYA
eukprot:2660970-Rhodomonas_salina.3